MREQGDGKIVLTLPKWDPEWVEPEALRARVLELFTVLGRMGNSCHPVFGSFSTRRDDTVELLFHSFTATQQEAVATVTDSFYHAAHEVCLALAGHALYWKDVVDRGETLLGPGGQAAEKPQVLAPQEVVRLVRDVAGRGVGNPQDFSQRLESLSLIRLTDIDLEEPSNELVREWMHAKRDQLVSIWWFDVADANIVPSGNEEIGLRVPTPDQRPWRLVCGGPGPNEMRRGDVGPNLDSSLSTAQV